VPAEQGPATRDPEFPLRWRADVGHFHAWGYGGVDAAAHAAHAAHATHATHVRHLADVWRALDEAGAP